MAVRGKRHTHKGNQRNKDTDEKKRAREGRIKG